MSGIAQNEDLKRVTGTAIPDNGLDRVIGESFIDYPRDQAALDKAREPLVHNGHPHLDVISRITYSELAWFFDPLREEQLPAYGPDAIAKMRQPLMGYSHYRVGLITLRILSDLAWS
jgi:hypothetical protein